MVSKYLQKAPCRISSQTDTVWPSINSRTAKSSLPAVRSSDAASHQTKHMSSFYMLPKGCTSNFRSFRQRLTRFWCSEAKSSLPAAKLPGTMAPKSELMDHLKMTPIGSPSNFRSIGHRMTVHQSSTSSARWNQVKHRRDPKRLQNSNKSPWLVLSNAQEASPQISGHSDIVWPSFNSWRKIGYKVFGFSKNRKLCALICTAFRQVFFRGIKPINEEKCQRKIQEKTEAKKPEKRPRNYDRTVTEKGAKAPWLPAALEIRVAGFKPKAPFFCSFSRFTMFGPCDFLKIWFLRHDIRRSSSTSRIRHRNHLIIIGHSETANRPTKKAHFLPDRSWNRLDRCCRPIGVNQCLNLHRHPTSNNMRIHRWSSQEEFQKTRRGPRLFKRLGDQLMKFNDLFMTTY